MELITQPTPLVLAHNQAPLEIAVDDVITPGVKAVYEMGVSESASSGTELCFKFGKRMVVFTVKAQNAAALDPYGSIPIQGSDTILAYRNMIWNILEKHPVLSSFYEITFNGSIVFTARNTGTEWNMVEMITGVDNDGNQDGDFDWRQIAQIIEGTDDVFTNQQAGIELLVEQIMGSGNYLPVISLNGIANKLNRINWELSGVLTDLFATSFLPELTSEDVRVIYDATRRFRILFEGIGSVTGQPNYYVALNSGVTKEDFAKFTDFEADVLGNRFLSWRTPLRTVTREQPEWLYMLQVVDRYKYFQNGLFDYLELNVKLYYDDDTNEVIKPFKDRDCQKYGILEWPTSYAALELDQKEVGKFITHYECWVVHNRDEDNQDPTIYEAVTEKVTYTLEEPDYLDAYFVYRNSFDVLETIRTTCVKESEIITKKKKIAKVLLNGYEPSDGELEFYQSVVTKPYQVTLSAKTRQDFEAFEEVLISKDAYWVVDGHLVKILVEEGKFKGPTDDDYTFVLPITFNFANVNSKFSNV